MKIPVEDCVKAGLLEKPSIKIAEPKLCIFMKDLTNLEPLFLNYPNYGGNEEVEQLYKYGYKMAKNLVIWLSLVFRLLFRLIKIIYNINRFTFPRLSMISLLIMLVVCAIYDTWLTFSYICLGVLAFLTYTHPYVIQNIHPWIAWILGKNANHNILERPCVKIWTKWEEHLYNENVV